MVGEFFLFRERYSVIEQMIGYTYFGVVVFDGGKTDRIVIKGGCLPDSFQEFWNVCNYDCIVTEFQNGVRQLHVNSARLLVFGYKWVKIVEVEKR